MAWRENANPLNYCPEEEDFHELYEVLGDPKAQEAIRQKNEEGLHCTMLKQSATACDGCPNNPFNKNKENRNEEILEEWRDTIDRGTELIDLAVLGLIEEELSPEEVIIMRSVYHYRKVQDMEFQAEMISSRLLFGGGGKKKT